jgi:hypothetical protein
MTVPIVLSIGFDWNGAPPFPGFLGPVARGPRKASRKVTLRIKSLAGIDDAI